MPCEITLHDEEGRTLDLTFHEEPLGLPAEHGFGYPMLKLGQRVGPAERFELLRKLGWGRHASVWLARDNVEHSPFVAVKVLTGNATDLVEHKVLLELEVMEKLRARKHDNCLSLLNHFKIPGAIPDDGTHLCVVTDLYATDVEQIWKACPNRQMPVPLTKRILRNVLQGLEQMHSAGLIHTDLKPANILCSHPPSTSPEAITALLSSSPSEVNPPEDSYCGQVQSAKSQPLSTSLTLEEAARCTYVLGDLGHAQLKDQRTVAMIASEHYRPPEVILGGPWNETVDIWMFGCLLFEFINGQTMFNRTPPAPMPPDRYHVGLMLKYLGQVLPTDLMNQYELADMLGFSAETGNLKAPIPIDPDFIPRLMREWLTPRGFDEEDIVGVSKLLLRCLRLNPAERPSARELLETEVWLRC